MIKLNKLIAAVIGIGLSFSLTACDPPMPDDLKVAESEKTILCEPGLVELMAPETLVDLVYGWSDAMVNGCADMQLGLVETLAEPAGLVVAPIGSDLSDPVFLKVPFAIDAAVLVVNLPDVYEIYLSAPTITKIFAGQIKNWNDPQILADNAGLDLPDIKIVLPTEALAPAKKSLSDWIGRLNEAPLDLSQIKDSKKSDAELASPEQEGAIAIASYSAAVLNGSVFASILTKPEDIESGVLASIESVYAAETQLVSTVDGDSITMVLDPKIEPKAQEGSIAVAAPYQAIFTIELNFVGGESTLVRTAGRFLMRQESQGTISSSTMFPMPESVRILAVKIIEKGLTVPAVE